MPWIDAHCHLADFRLDKDRESLILAAQAAGIGTWIQGGVNPDDWQKQRKLRAKWGTAIQLSFGLHPWWVAKSNEAALESGLKELANAVAEADALGELGLDFQDKFETSQSLQRTAFERQLALGKQFEKPMILHIVRAHSEALKLLKPGSWRGIVHSYSGSWEEAKQYIDLGFLISISGVITGTGRKALHEVVQKVGSEHLVVETDSPDQPPWKADGSRHRLSEPVMLLETAASIAEIRGVTTSEILNQSAKNLRSVFKNLS